MQNKELSTINSKLSIAIIGLGYVGLPLAHAFAKKYEVVGFDIHQSRIDELNNAEDRTLELSIEQLKEVLPKFNKELKTHNLKLTTDVNAISDCNI
jgi:UDP-N-acetyl-D-galactosamine dehydrogenase